MLLQVTSSQAAGFDACCGPFQLIGYADCFNCPQQWCAAPLVCVCAQGGLAGL